MATTKTTTSKPAAKKAASKPAFSAEERAAMKDAVSEAQATAKRGGKVSKDDGTADVLAKLADMPPADRELGEAFHALVTATAPDLAPRTYYGMPAYAKDDKVVFWFKNASKFKTRYATIGFSDKAALDDGDLWPTEYAVTTWNPAVEKQLRALIERAVG